MLPIKKKVLLLEVLRLVIPIIIVGGIFTGRIPPLLAGKVLGIAGLLFGAYFLYVVSYAYMPSPISRQVQWSLFARLSPLPAAFPVKS